MVTVIYVTPDLKTSHKGHFFEKLKCIHHLKVEYISLPLMSDLFV